MCKQRIIGSVLLEKFSWRGVEAVIQSRVNSKRFILLLLGVLLLLSGCAGKENHSTSGNASQASQIKKLLCSLPADGVSLYATRLEAGTYSGLVLERKGTSREINLSTTSDPKYPPTLTDSSRNIEDKRNLELTVCNSNQAEPHTLTRWYDPKTLEPQTITLASNGGFKLLTQGLDMDGNYSSLRLKGNGVDAVPAFTIPQLPRDSLPILTSHDWDGDGKLELAVFYAVASGTGVDMHEAHVLNPDTMQEIPIEDPRQVLAKKVSSSLDRDKIKIQLPNRTICLATRDYVPADAKLSESLGGAILTFEIGKNSEIIARSAVDTYATTNYIGDYLITYQFREGAFKMKDIDFKLY